MQIDRLFMMLLRRLLGPLLNRGIEKGIDLATGGGKAPADMTPDERARARQGKQLARRARQAARLTRRAGRF